jgi:hypothetical protein
MFSSEVVTLDNLKVVNVLRTCLHFSAEITTDAEALILDKFICCTNCLSLVYITTPNGKDGLGVGRRGYK